MIEEIKKIAKGAGAFIREEARHFDPSVVDQKKGYSDLVSYVDKEAERMIVEGLEKLDTSIGFIAEEGHGKPGESCNWIIDPLDGTTNFIHQLPVYSVSIALAEGEELVSGVVYDVFHDQMFWAEAGKGTFCNDDKITVSDSTELQQTLLATGFPYYDFDKVDSYLEILKFFMQNTRGLRRMGSAAIDLAYTAAGRFDGFFEFNLNSYDVAAGALLVKEAGGIVTDFSGGSNYLFGREIVATSPGVNQAILEILNKHWS